jgi:hypothetical protein
MLLKSSKVSFVAAFSLMVLAAFIVKRASTKSWWRFLARDADFALRAPSGSPLGGRCKTHGRGCDLSHRRTRSVVIMLILAPDASRQQARASKHPHTRHELRKQQAFHSGGSDFRLERVC